MGDQNYSCRTHNTTMQALLVSALVAAPGYAAPDLAEPPVYTYQYGVNDDYSGANFQQLSPEMDTQPLAATLLLFLMEESRLSTMLTTEMELFRMSLMREFLSMDQLLLKLLLLLTLLPMLLLTLLPLLTQLLMLLPTLSSMVKKPDM